MTRLLAALTLIAFSLGVSVGSLAWPRAAAQTNGSTASDGPLNRGASSAVGPPEAKAAGVVSPVYTYQTLPQSRADVDGDGAVSFADAQMVVGYIKYHATQTAEAIWTNTATANPTTSTPTAPFTVTAIPTWTPTPSLTASPTSSTSTLLDLLIANRGQHQLPHEITLADPMGSYSWGQHATEDTPSISGPHSLNAWLAAFRNNGEATQPGARIYVRRVAAWVLTNGSWLKCYDGSMAGQWLVSSNQDTSGDYQNIAVTNEADGSISFTPPPAPRAVHFSTNPPTCVFSGSTAVAVTVEARMTGAGTWGMAPGADFRDTAGSGGSIEQSCWGKLNRLTTTFRVATCLSSSLTDAQIRNSNPPF